MLIQKKMCPANAESLLQLMKDVDVQIQLATYADVGEDFARSTKLLESDDFLAPFTFQILASVKASISHPRLSRVTALLQKFAAVCFPTNELFNDVNWITKKREDTIRYALATV